jgi:integrase
MAKKASSKKYPGVYYTESTTRKHRGKPDRIFWIAWNDNGKKWLRIGAASQGITEDYANQKRIDILNKRNLGENPAFINRRKTVTLDRIISGYLDNAESEGKHIRAEKSRYSLHIKPVFGNTIVSSLSASDLGKYKASLQEKLSPSSAKKVFALIRAAVNFALRRKMITGQNPISLQSDFTIPRENNHGERFLTVDEAKVLLDELEKRSTRLWHMATLSLITGMRSTEIFSLRGADIDEKNCLAIIRAKGGEREPILLPKEALDILTRYRSTPDGLLFPDKNGNRLKAISDTFNRTVAALGLNAGITDTRHKVWFHTLRHTFASWLAQSGEVGIYELMKLMRHKRVEMTLRYAHLIPDHQREKLSVIGCLLNQ